MFRAQQVLNNASLAVVTTWQSDFICNAINNFIQDQVNFKNNFRLCLTQGHRHPPERWLAPPVELASLRHSSHFLWSCRSVAANSLQIARVAFAKVCLVNDFRQRTIFANSCTSIMLAAAAKPLPLPTLAHGLASPRHDWFLRSDFEGLWDIWKTLRSKCTANGLSDQGNTSLADWFHTSLCRPLLRSARCNSRYHCKTLKLAGLCKGWAYGINFNRDLPMDCKRVDCDRLALSGREATEPLN